MVEVIMEVEAIRVIEAVRVALQKLMVIGGGG